jgi:hypothetical protein
VRVIARSRGDDYQYTHFHPADCAGVLMSFDSVPGDAAWREPMSDWPPAGPKWREHPADAALGIAAVTIQARDPLAACERWCALLDRPAQTGGDRLEIALDRGKIRFVAPVDDDGTGVVGLDIEVRDGHAALERARAAGLPVAGGAVEIGGVVIRPVSI